MTKEQLLIPRVLVIGGKEGEPNDTSGDFISGDILTQTLKGIHKWRSEKLKHSVYLDPKYIDKFPHLFKPLQWWEYRKPEEMPEYIHFKWYAFYKVMQWESITNNIWQFVLNDGRKFSYNMASWATSPATREEYEECQKQKEV